MISVETIIKAPLEKVWQLWVLPEDIVKWNHPSEDWETSFAENNLKSGGTFKYTMKAKDESAAFDFEGIYTDVKMFELIEYKLFDNRTGSIRFDENENGVKITEIFEPNIQDSESMQKQWCQAVIDNFKHYVEAN